MSNTARYSYNAAPLILSLMQHQQCCQDQIQKQNPHFHYHDHFEKDAQTWHVVMGPEEKIYPVKEINHASRRRIHEAIIYVTFYHLTERTLVGIEITRS